jgi:hypothetical protein
MRVLSPPAVVVDAGYRNRTAIRIDANAAPAIIEGLLSLRGGARQQKGGDRENRSHHDLRQVESQSNPALRKFSAT